MYDGDNGRDSGAEGRCDGMKKKCLLVIPRWHLYSYQNETALDKLMSFQTKKGVLNFNDCLYT